MTAQSTPLEFLQSIWRDDAVPLPVRMRAAIEAAPFVHAKLSVNANLVGFAAQMEAAMEQVGKRPVIDAQPSNFQNVEVLKEKD